MEPITMDADDHPTNTTDDTPLPLTLFAQMHFSEFENIDFTYGIQNKEERGLWRPRFYATWDRFASRDDRESLDLAPTPDYSPMDCMSTPSLSSVGSSSTQSSASTTPLGHSLNIPGGPSSTAQQKYSLFEPVYSLDESEQFTSPFCVQRVKTLQRRRFTVEQTKELETWLLSHSSDPYPNHEEKQRLATCTDLLVRQVETWLSRARSRKLTRNSAFQKRLPTTSSVLEEPSSQSPLQRSSLITEAGGEPVIPESSSVTLEPKASENSGAGTHVAPPKVNGESITSSLPALVNAVVLVQRLNRTRPSKLNEAASPPVNAVPAAASRPSLGDTPKTPSGRGIAMESWLSQLQESLSSSPKTDSVNSFEDDSPEDSSRDEDKNATIGCWSTFEGLSSENMLSMLRPLFTTLPDEISQPLTHDLTLLFDSWAVNGSLERPSHPPSSSSSTPPRSQANSSAGSPTEHTSSSGSGKKRPLLNGDELPGDGDDDKNGDETRKCLRLSSQSQEDIALKWACPFYQRSPHQYCVETQYGDYRKCAKSPGFSEVHRVKDHIYKCHISIYCDRCYSVFKNEDDLTAHRRDPSPCLVQDPRPMQGLTNEQKKLLKPRNRNKSEKERWITIYKICFPNDEISPSPYYVFYSRETAELRRDVLTIVDEEMRSLDDTVRNRIHERLQHAFNNVQMRSSLGIMGLLPFSSSETSSQQLWGAGPSPRLPLASRSAAVTSISHQAIPTVTAEPGHTAPKQDSPFGEFQGYDADDHLPFDSMTEYPAIGEGGEDVSELFSTGGTYS